MCLISIARKRDTSNIQQGPTCRRLYESDSFSSLCRWPSCGGTARSPHFSSNNSLKFVSAERPANAAGVNAPFLDKSTEINDVTISIGSGRVTKFTARRLSSESICRSTKYIINKSTQIRIKSKAQEQTLLKTITTQTTTAQPAATKLVWYNCL